MKTNKPVKVSENGRHQGYIDLHRTFWGRVWYKTKMTTKWILKWCAIGAVGYGIYVFGGLMDKTIQYETVEAKVEVETPAPVMDKIADCETGERLPNGKAKPGTSKHYGKSGQVLMTGNNNKSVDVGRYAINSVWFKQATELDLDLTDEDDNRSMAYWIYKNRGTGDWSASASCWK